MIRTVVFSLMAFTMLNNGSSVRAGVIYAVDLDGFVDHLGISHGVPAGADLWWANQFDVQPGGNVVTEIGLSFGSNLTVGNPLTLAVYDDPNNDGNPNDAVLLRSTIIQITESDGNFDPPTFFPIAPTLVSGKFLSLAC